MDRESHGTVWGGKELGDCRCGRGLMFGREREETQSLCLCDGFNTELAQKERERARS